MSQPSERAGRAIPRGSPVREALADPANGAGHGEAEPPLRLHVDWERALSGVRLGITGPDVDYGLSSADSAWQVAARYEALGRRLGFPAVAVGRQVHGSEIAVLDRVPPAGFLVTGQTDGIVSRGRGVLLAVTAADCVPVYLVSPDRDVAGLLHAGWRGTAAGVLGEGLRCLRERFEVGPEELWMHLGPAVCGDCYEVGREVAEALGHEAPGGPDATCHVDLRHELSERALAAGVPPERITVSEWCTACEPDLFHSHRGRGSTAGRMAAFLGRL